MTTIWDYVGAMILIGAILMGVIYFRILKPLWRDYQLNKVKKEITSNTSRRQTNKE